MGDVLVRGVPDPIIQRIKARADRHGRSLQQELLRVLAEAADELDEHFLQGAREHRARYVAENRTFSDSTELIREDRER